MAGRSCQRRGARAGRGRWVDVAPQGRKATQRQRFRASQEAIAASRGRSVDAETSNCRPDRKQKNLKAGISRSPLTDSNRRPLSMKKGRGSTVAFGASPSQGGGRGGGWRAGLISLSPPRGGGRTACTRCFKLERW